MAAETDDGPRSDDTRDERSRRGLNLALAVLVLTCSAAVLFVGDLMVSEHRASGGDLSGGWHQDAWSVVTDRRAEAAASRAGEETGRGVVTAVPAAPREEQRRIAEALDSATAMVTAFVNLRYDDADATVEEVLSMAAGDFARRYRKSAAHLVETAQDAQTVMTGEVVWAGYVSGDADVATVLLAANGSVEDNRTEQPEARTYRVRVELVRDGARWLTRDLRFVA